VMLPAHEVPAAMHTDTPKRAGYEEVS
jgi:hypothetical protein